MAVTSEPPPNNHHLQPPSTIPINMSSLTHSELLSLSLFSSSSSSCTPPSDVVSTSQFLINPSLSTNQQTYSPSPHPHHRRLQHHDRLESNLIISFLKKELHYRDNNISNDNNNDVIDIVNKDGVVLDLAALEERDRHGGLFVDELRRMANGKINEDELLQMLADIQGEWCSRRKKARVVDASFLGDALPLGWKLIVALRRKAGRFSPYCRRYISPTGQRFSSCKEVSSYLQSYYGINDAKLVRDSRVECQPFQTVDPVNHMCINSERDNSMLNRSNATMCNTCAPMEHEKEASISGIDNLPDVQVCDLYECHSCNISFDTKDKYLQHMFALHQKTTKRYTLDSSVGDKVLIKDGKSECPKRKRRRKHGLSVADGVIIKNGKYGCQFCDKVFEERRRYLGHVGNHVKGSIKTPTGSLVQVNGSAKSPCMDKLPTVISNSRMDALIEIAQSSMQDTCAPVFEKEPSSVNHVDRLRAAKNSHVVDADRKTKENSSSCLTEVDMDKSCRDRTFSADLYPCETLSKISSVCASETAREGLEEGKTSSQELHPPCRVNETSLSDAVNHLDSSPGEHDGEGIDEDKSLSSELNPQCILGEIPRTNENNNASTSYPNEGELEKNVKEGKTLPKKMSPLAKMSKSSFSEMNPQGKVGKILRTDEIINVTTSCPNKFEFSQNAREVKTLSSKMSPLAKMAKCPSLELNSQGKASKILSTDEDIDVATSCPSQCEIKRDVKEGEALSTELNPLAKTSKMSTTNEEIKGRYFICNTLDSEKYSCFGTPMTPDAGSGIADNVTGNGSCKSTVAEEEKSADKPLGVNNIHYLLCQEKASDPISSGENIQLEHMHNFEPQHEQKYNDSELVTVSGKNHASGCTVLQSSLNSSSTFDEIFEKAGQDICSLDQNLDSESGVEYMKLDAIEPQMYKYNAMNQEDSISFYEVSMDLENNIGLELELDSSLKIQSEFPQEMSGKCLTTTVCVWCGVKFSHEVVDVEPQPDSVGFMCPACRAKISKQFNELETKGSWRRKAFHFRMLQVRRGKRSRQMSREFRRIFHLKDYRLGKA